MWQYNKKLEHPVKIKEPNPALAKLIITQFGGPDGELGASMRYLSQRYGCPNEQTKGLLTDIGGEAPKLPLIPLKPAWGLDFRRLESGWGIEVSKLPLLFQGKADKRCCRAWSDEQWERLLFSHGPYPLSRRSTGAAKNKRNSMESIAREIMNRRIQPVENAGSGPPLFYAARRGRGSRLPEQGI